MNDDCIFCKIVKKETPSQVEVETDDLLVFKDINPKAPIHFLIIPKKHIKDITEVDDQVFVEIKNMVLSLAKKYNVGGFRIVTNAGAAAAVGHMHVHFLGEVKVEREI
ncbi:HIT domain-containing protein [Candidatus Woesebacteria bacterium]|nr:HIT domain-containing protein [Candidatus Woesebacteria bacterium]